MAYRIKNFEEEDFTQEDSDAIRTTVYARYQYRWLYTNGYSMADLSSMADIWSNEKNEGKTDLDFYDFLFEHGVSVEPRKGHIYYDYDTFIKEIYPDEDFVMDLLMESDTLSLMYYLDRDFSGISNEVIETETEEVEI